MDWLTDPNAWLSLLTLTLLEIVLGIDNIIFISVLSGKLPHEQQGRARTVGLMLALITRVLLLCSIYLLTKLTKPLFVLPVLAHAVSGKDLVLIVGGLFLIWKSTHEIHGSLEGVDHEVSTRVKASFGSVVTQIILIDIVFSLDSVITAVGMAQYIGVMVAAVVIAVFVMLLASKSISDFVNQRPTIKMLALSFLLLIGVVLVADGFGQHVPKGYIYFAMAFSFGVELLNLRLRRKTDTHIELRKKI
jgi:predicted tellurium resistance membrane protein TerC